MTLRRWLCACPARLAWVAAVALVVFSFGGVARADNETATPLISALERGDTYVDPAFYPAGTAAQVRTNAAELAKRGEQVKLAAIAPLSGGDIFDYAVALRDYLKYPGTLVVTTPGGAVGAAGPRDQVAIQNALQAVGADQVSGAASRLLLSAEVSTPPPSDSDDGIRDLIVLVGLALLGAAFAIGWGMRREQRRIRERAIEARGILAVYADALGARAAVLGRMPGQTSEVRAIIEAVDAHHVAAAALIGHAMTEQDLKEGAASLRAGFGEAEHAGRILGVDMPAADPFADLCSVDPAHGPSVDHDGDAPLCGDCIELLGAGHELTPRSVLVGGHSAPYRDAPVPYAVTTPDGAPVG